MAYGISLAAALGLVVSLAWIGHSGSATGSERYVDLGIDALHLVAATAWVGGLLPLLLFLSAYRGSTTSIACMAAQRFSILGMVSVATLMLSGVINSARLVGSFQALGTTDYGRVLTTKLGLFLLMLIFAAINRLRETPLIASLQKHARSAAVHHLIRNTAIEFALGCCTLALVGLLGILHPAAHLIGSAQP
jgi:putative copper resistance protein D